MKEIAEQVDSAPGSASAASPEFDRANQIQACVRSGTDCLVVAGECIVVGNCKSIELQRDGVIDQLSLSITSIRLIGVRVQIDQSSSFLSRKAFPITETELRVMAALAMIGLKRMPKKGYSAPAAIGTPIVL